MNLVTQSDHIAPKTPRTHLEDGKASHLIYCNSVMRLRQRIAVQKKCFENQPLHAIKCRWLISPIED